MIKVVNFLDLRFNIVLKYLKLAQILSNHQSYKDYADWYEKSSDESKACENFNLAYIKASSRIFYSIPDKYLTYKICLEAVRGDSCLLSKIPKHFLTKEICELAISKLENKNFQPVLASVPEKFKTYEFCLKAIQIDPGSLEHVPINIIDYSMCKKSVLLDGEAISCVPDKFQTEELKLLAINQTWQAIRYIKEQTYEMCEIAVLKNSYAFAHITNPSHKTVDLAIKAMLGARIWRFYKTIDICPNPNFQTTFKNLFKMKAREDEIKANQNLISNTLKGLN